MASAHVRAKLGAPNYRVEINANEHALVADEPPELGGGDAGPSPFALVLSGLSGCTLITLKMYADRKAMPVTGIEVELRLLAGDPKRRIERHVDVGGPLSLEQIARLREIVERTPVTLALMHGFDIDTTLDGGAA